jgi:hypothetical protein
VNYWERSDRKVVARVIETGDLICLPDYLDTKGMKVWYGDIHKCVTDGILEYVGY